MLLFFCHLNYKEYIVASSLSKKITAAVILVIVQDYLRKWAKNK